MRPGVTKQPAASITSSSIPSERAAARASSSPMRTILPPASRTGCRPRGSGAWISPFSMRVSTGLVFLAHKVHRGRLRPLETLLLGEADPRAYLQAVETRGIEDGVAVEV